MRAHAQAVVLSSKLDGRFELKTSRFELKTALEIRSPDVHEKLVCPRRVNIDLMF